ncbi:bleomycin resistance protein [Bdellovibrio bacteriovorus]|uniref:bleomycin resistance protein n=1 Tax=Bdellovibrio bacteriovorus TaxID=959 RepID=UPI003AA8DE9E
MNTAILSPAIPQLPSGDIEKTAQFMEQKLGFKVVAKMIEHGFLSVKRGPCEIHFWKTASESDAKTLGSQSSCYIRVENIEALFAEFKDRGVVFRYELTKQPWGMNEMQIDDPYLNAIRFGESFE